MPLESSFCARAILQEDFLLVPDATKDSRFDCNPPVTGEPHMRFYAGALMTTQKGKPSGRSACWTTPLATRRAFPHLVHGSLASHDTPSTE
jgi:hypothetical protein